MGGLVGLSISSEINWSVVNATIQGFSNVGGVVGRADNTELLRVIRYAGSIRYLQGNIGGIAGHFKNSTMIQCSVENTEIKHKTSELSSSPLNIGGLVGFQDNSTISESYTKTKIQSRISENMGGLSGLLENDSHITNSYSQSDIEGLFHVGGLVGAMQGLLDTQTSVIQTSYYGGNKIRGQGDTGGLVGKFLNMTNLDRVKLSYWNRDSGQGSSQGGGESKSKNQMKDKNTYKGFQFGKFWKFTQDQMPDVIWQQP